MDNNAITPKAGSRILLQVQVTLILLVSACLLPFAVHLIPPYQGIPIGAYFLPMFYVPFVAVVFYRLHVGLLIAFLAPIANYLILGSPDFQFLYILSFELVVFTFFSFLLLQTTWKIFAAPMAYLFAKIVSSFILLLIPVLPVSPFSFFSNSIINGAPGIIVLFLLNWLLIRKWNK